MKSPVIANPKYPQILKGILWMVLAGIMFVALTVLVRHLGSNLPAVEAAFIRYLFGLIMLIPFAMRNHFRAVTTKSLKLYTLRGLAHSLGVALSFYAMVRIPIAEISAIGYTTPIFVALGAVFFLREKIHCRRLIAIAIGLVGTLIILRPGFQTISMGTLAQVVAAPCFAISYLLAKKLTDTEDATSILIMLTVCCTIVLLPGAMMQWQTPQLGELSWLCAVAFVATAGHYALTRSFYHAPLTVTQPFSFLQLIWAVAMGFLFFEEIPDIWVCIGGLVIVVAISYLTHREAVASNLAA